MKPNDQGFALIIVLIFIGILSEIIISMMHSAMFTSKITQNISTYSNYIYKTDVALEEARQSILNKNLDCFNTWCSLEGDFLKSGETISYKINFLQTIPCFQIEGAEKIGVDFFKISIKLVNHLDILNVESTFATTAQNVTHCAEKVKSIKPESSSWKVV